MSIKDKYPNLVELAEEIQEVDRLGDINSEYDINDLLIVEQEGHFDINILETLAGSLSAEERGVLQGLSPELYDQYCNGDGKLVSLSSVMEEMFNR